VSTKPRPRGNDRTCVAGRPDSRIRPIGLLASGSKRLTIPLWLFRFKRHGKMRVPERLGNRIAGASFAKMASFRATWRDEKGRPGIMPEGPRPIAGILPLFSVVLGATRIEAPSLVLNSPHASRIGGRA
jgi:hypothetical protein